MGTENMLIITYDESLSDLPSLVIAIVNGKQLNVCNAIFGEEAKKIYNLLKGGNCEG